MLRPHRLLHHATDLRESFERERRVVEITHVYHPRMIMLLLTIVIIGALVYLVETYVKMSPPFLMLFRIVVLVAVVIWIMKIFGIVDLPVPRIG